MVHTHEHKRVQTLSFTVIEPVAQSQTIFITKAKASDLGIGAVAKASGVFKIAGGYKRDKDEVVSLSILDHRITDGNPALGDILFNHDAMTGYFDTPQNKERFLGIRSQAVVAFVDKSWAGNAAFRDGSGKSFALFGDTDVPIPAGAPVTAGGHLGGGRSTTNCVETTGRAVVWFTVTHFKFEQIGEKFYLGPPRIVSDNRSDQHARLAAEMSWAKHGSPELLVGSNVAGDTDMVELAHFVAPQEEDKWSMSMTNGLTMIQQMCPPLASMKTDPNKQWGAFSTSPTSASSDATRAFVKSLAAGTVSSDVKMDDASDDEKMRRMARNTHRQRMLSCRSARRSSQRFSKN